MQKKLVVLSMLLLATLASAAQATLRNGVTIKMSGAATLVLDNFTLANNGTFNQDAGLVKFTGNVSVGLTGPSKPSFNELEIAKGVNTALFLAINTDVAKSIKFTSGYLELNGATLTLKQGGILINENENSRITGSHGGHIETTVQLNPATGQNPGNLGLLFVSGPAFGTTTIKRFHEPYSGSPSIGTIARYFEIIPQTASLQGTRLRQYYFLAELAGIKQSCLGFYYAPVIPPFTSWRPNPSFSSQVHDRTAKYIENYAGNNYHFWSLGYVETGGPAPCYVIGGAATNGEAQAPVFPEQKQQFIRRIYPTNAVADRFFIETGELPVQQVQVHIYDMQGRLLLNRKIPYQSQWINLPDLTKGVYQVKISSEEKVWQGKIVKQ